MSNLNCGAFTEENLIAAMEIVASGKEFEMKIKRWEERAKERHEVGGFYEWLKGNCQDQETILFGKCAVAVAGSIPIPRFMYDKLKPWMDKYDQGQVRE